MAAVKNNARLTDPTMLIQAGIDPRTGLPVKASSLSPCNLKADIKKNLRIMDEQNAINCFTWYNLPSGITPQLLERILYYRGQGMFFYMEEVNKFFFLPYALDGSIDVYGRFKTVTPLPFNGVSKASDDKDKDRPWIQGLTRDVIYEVELPENYIDQKTGEVKVQEILDKQNGSCVLLKDYTEQISQTNISRQILNDPLLDVMSDMIPFARTALLNGTGVQGMRVGSEDEGANVMYASQAINDAALNGKKWIPIVGNVEFQDLTDAPVAKAEEYFLALQSLDNLRLSFYGLDNGGLFQKKSHMLEAEQEMNQGNVGLVMRDRLQNRQNFCTLVNSIWGLGIWCDISETVIGLDKDGDMVAGDNEDQGSNMGGTSGGNNDDM